MLFYTLLYSSVLAGPLVNHKYVVHESRTRLPDGWQQVAKVPSDFPIPLKFALAQNNVENLEKVLMDVSDPKSSNYGNHYSVQEIADMFAPSKQTVDRVTTWLVDSGISFERIKTSRSKGFLHLDATIQEAQDLLKTEYFLFDHETGTKHVACHEYSLPEHVVDHLDYVTPSVNFDTPLPKTHITENLESESKDQAGNLAKRQTQVSNLLQGLTTAAGSYIQSVGNLLGAAGRPYSPIKPQVRPIPQAGSVSATSLGGCFNYTTPYCLQTMYSMPNNTAAGVNSGNSYGIVEFSPQAYLQSDLNGFWASLGQGIPQGYAPTLNNLYRSGQPQTSQTGPNYNTESNLDLEYAMRLVYPQAVTLYQVGDENQGGSFNTFLDGLDSSYCGGDDPVQDPKYPNPNGYTGNDCGIYANSVTKVISISYGYNEIDLTNAYERRQCNEYMKLGATGVTFLVASGDAGVAGNGGSCLAPGSTPNNAIDAPAGTGAFNPSFPATCPYVTAVGATQLKQGTKVVAGATLTNFEEAATTLIQSGGGFSNVFGLPSYQSSAVTSYLKNNPPPYTAAQYNNSGAARGYPDISMNGVNYVVATNGAFRAVYGTSASTPVAGALFTLINQARLNAGQSPVGFVNPFLYGLPQSTFNDVTAGSNPGCGTNGFAAATNWDPATGLGTLNYTRLLNAFVPPAQPAAAASPSPTPSATVRKRPTVSTLRQRPTVATQRAQ